MFKLILLLAFIAFCVADNMWEEKGFTPAPGDKEKVLGKLLMFFHIPLDLDLNYADRTNQLNYS
ncbi:hypothetical protein EON65_18945 [archaeon]|nr:MAG: hypothetical protein EON65_18945 [archaeon]